MIDISNKLHAMVDEFVSNLSSECVTLAHNVSNHGHMYVARVSGPNAVAAPRSSNRTTSEVLSGLRRPPGSQAVDYNNSQELTCLDQTKSNLQEGLTRCKEVVGSSRNLKDMKHRSGEMEPVKRPNGVRSVHSVSPKSLPRDEVKHRRRSNDKGRKGKCMETVELLSSDNSSDEGHRRHIRVPQKLLRKPSSTKTRNSDPKGRSAGIVARSPSRSRESSHLLSYSYEETNSHDKGSPVIDPTPEKLRWPEEVGDLDESGGTGDELENNKVHSNSEPPKRHEEVEDDIDLALHSGDEDNDVDLGLNSHAPSSGDKELHVLPKVPVKRKLMPESRVSERRTQRGRPKCASPSVKKPRTPTLDYSVITQLVFGTRHLNCVSTADM